MEELEEKTTEISDGIRYEIIDALYHKVLQYTRRPETIEYTAVCNALVTKFPCLEDSGDCAYVSNNIDS